MSDLKFGLRQLLKQPGYMAVAILTLAPRIGNSRGTSVAPDGFSGNLFRPHVIEPNAALRTE